MYGAGAIPPYLRHWPRATPALTQCRMLRRWCTYTATAVHPGLPHGAVLRCLLPGRPTADCLFQDVNHDGRR